MWYTILRAYYLWQQDVEGKVLALLQANTAAKWMMMEFESDHWIPGEVWRDFFVLFCFVLFCFS